jgi:hypothetical protein
LLGELSLRGKLIARAEVALFEEALDLRDDALIEAAPADRLDNGQGLPPQTGLVRWSDQIVAQPKPKVKSASSGQIRADLRGHLDAHILLAPDTGASRR